MKNNKMSPVQFRIISLISVIIVSLLACVLFSFSPGTDYTQDYSTFSQVKDITSTYQLMDFCHENGIDYSINNNQFTLKEHSFSFKVNKTECTLNNNTHMNNFYLLESGRYDMFNEEENSYLLKTWGANYQLCNDSYVLYNMWPAAISLLVAVIFVIVTCVYIYTITTCKRCTTGKHETQHTETQHTETQRAETQQ